jgi:DNA-binding response OmpR family regulator
MTAGRAVLIVEDEPLLAMDLEAIVSGMGYDVVGPAFRLADGLELARTATINAALLDINLLGERSDPIAVALRERGIPYAFATGYGARGTDHDVPVLSKPYTPEIIRDTLAALIDTAG